MKPRDVTGSFDELSRLSGDAPTLGEERAARRKGAAAPPARAPFVAEARAVTQRALGLADEKGELAVPGVGAEQLADLAAQTDDGADFISPILAEILGADPVLAGGAAVDPRRLGLTIDQRDEMSGLRRSAAHLRRCVVSTRRELGGELRQMGQRLVGHIEALLEPGAGDRTGQEILRSDAAELLLAWQAIKEGPLSQREGTLAAQAGHAGQLGAEADRATVLRALLAVRSGQDLGEEEWDRAADLYDALSQDAATQGKERRGRGR